MSDVTEVKGVGETTGEKLRLAGIKSVAALARADAKKVARKTGVSESIVARLIRTAQESLGEDDVAAASTKAKASDKAADSAASAAQVTAVVQALKRGDGDGGALTASFKRQLLRTAIAVPAVRERIVTRVAQEMFD